jgi:hypothetical protein
MCPSCQDLQSEFAITTPADLTKAIRVAQANVAGGTLCADDTPSDGSPPIGKVEPDGPWDDHVYYVFTCRSCGAGFELSAETYHGRGGAWRPVTS